MKIIIWKEIEGYKNYMISDHGEVFSLISQKILKKNKKVKKKDGYTWYQTCIYNGSRASKYTPKISKLVAMTFIPNTENKPEVDHINRNSLDDRAINLRWADRSEQTINRGVQKNNKLGIKNIRQNKEGNYRVVIHRKKKKVFDKTYETIEEAIKERDTFLSSL